VQFRALGYIRRHPGTSLSDVAEHIGLTLPSISTMISKLETRNLVMRQSAPGDRRRICLELTAFGESVLRSASEATRVRLIQILADLSPAERAEVSDAMHSLQRAFGGGQAKDRSSGNKER